MNAAEISGLVAAFAGGVVTSLHCVGMCGPLACAVCLRRPDRRHPALLTYHVSRVGAYSAMGAVAGAVGRLTAGEILRPLTGFAPWVFLVFFAAVALGLDRWTAALLRGSHLFAPVVGATGRCGTVTGAGLLGTATPLLPCGPLYLMAGAAVLTGSGLQGATLLAAFASGTVPFPLLVQSGLGAAGTRISPHALDFWRRGLAAVSALFVLARIMAPLGTSACTICR